MAQFTVRNLEDDVKKRLQARGWRGLLAFQSALKKRALPAAQLSPGQRQQVQPRK